MASVLVVSATVISINWVMPVLTARTTVPRARTRQALARNARLDTNLTLTVNARALGMPMTLAAIASHVMMVSTGADGLANLAVKIVTSVKRLPVHASSVARHM